MDVITFSKETVMYNKLKRSDVYCKMMDLSKAYTIESIFVYYVINWGKLIYQDMSLVLLTLWVKHICLHIFCRANE